MDVRRKQTRRHHDSPTRPPGAAQSWHPAGAPSWHGPAPLAGPPLSSGAIVGMQRTLGNQATQRSLQRAPGPDASGPDPKRRALAEQIRQEIETLGGLNVAVYLENTVDPSLKGTKKWAKEEEFRRQADQYALDHGSYGVRSGKLRLGVAMVIDDQVGDMMGTVTGEAEQLLDEFPDLFDERHPRPSVKIQTLSVFTHGQRKKLKAGSTGNRQLKPAQFVSGMAPLLTAAPTINLYACKAAGAVPEGEQNFATDVQEALTEQLNEIYGHSFVEVWGHTSAAHTTFNPDLAMVGPAGGFDLQQDLARRMVDLVLGELGAEVSESERAALERSGAKLIKTVFHIKKQKGDPAPPAKDPTKAFTGWLNPMNIYFREIGLLGLDRVWADLTAESTPADYSDLGMSAEAHDRMVQGAGFFRQRFQGHLESFRSTVRAVVGDRPGPARPGSLSGEEIHGAIEYNRGQGYPKEQVERMQGRVGASPTGEFEEPTVLAVAGWQGQHDLTDDGKVGPRTRDALLGAPKQPSQGGEADDEGWLASLWEDLTGWLA